MYVEERRFSAAYLCFLTKRDEGATVHIELTLAPGK
jgi:hypothetical protein